MDIDPKERWLIEHALVTVQSRYFSERDVLALLILLRRHAAPDSVVREFGDFVAHREKDRGVLQKYLRRVQLELRGQQPKREGPVVLPVYTADNVHMSFNAVLTEMDFEAVNAELGNRLTVCIISLLQSVQVDTKLSAQVRGFAVGMSSTHVALLGHGVTPAGHVFQFPLVVANNRDYERSLSMMHVDFLMRCDRIVEAFCSGGEFWIEQRPQSA